MTRTWRDVIEGTAPWSCEEADCRCWLATVPDNSVHCVVTSPPYFSQRDYGCAGQIGLEKTPTEYVAEMVKVFAEVRRVLHPSGSLWLNLGDTYSAHPNQRKATDKPGDKQATNRGSIGTPSCSIEGLKPKDLIGIPWMTAFALRADGWWLRQHCGWLKRNSMPESVTDRPGTACEEVFLLTKRSDYFFDMEAVKKQSGYRESGNKGKTWGNNETDTRDEGIGKVETMRGIPWEGDTRNFRNSDLWFDSVGMLLSDDGDMLGLDVPVKGLKAAHFAVMPEALVEPLILAGTSAKGVCPQCGEPWTRVVEKERKATRPGDGSKVHEARDGYHECPKDAARRAQGLQSNKSGLHSQYLKKVGNRDPERHTTTTRTVGWEAGCSCDAGEPIPAVVMDPFTGAGTVAKVAVSNGRRFIGCELNPEYMGIITKRLGTVTPPLPGVTA